jgi:hypothetical protein
LATAAADSKAPHIAAVAAAVVAVKNLMMAAPTIVAEVAALPITVVAAEAASTTPTTPVETETTVFLAKKVKKKASVSPCHRSYLSSSLILLAPAIAGIALGQSVLITCFEWNRER